MKFKYLSISISVMTLIGLISINLNNGNNVENQPEASTKAVEMSQTTNNKENNKKNQVENFSNDKEIVDNQMNKPIIKSSNSFELKPLPMPDSDSGKVVADLPTPKPDSNEVVIPLG